MTVKQLFDAIEALSNSVELLKHICEHQKRVCPKDDWECSGCPFFDIDADIDNEEFDACIYDIVKDKYHKMLNATMELKVR